jgi:peptidoglycan DL-endopeptidase CwlO
MHNVKRYLYRSMAIGCLMMGLLGSTVFAAFGDVTLKYGMNSMDVTALQEKLNILGYTIEKVDGTFGSSTLQAVIMFQTDNGLEADGVVGAATFRYLAEAKPTPAQYVVQAGDSLHAIAQKYNLSASDLARTNNISDRGKLKVGQILVLPEGTQVSRAASYGFRTKGTQIVAMAQRFMNVPYVWGGSAPNGFDCSGFTYYLYAKQGIFLPRPADEQFGVGQWIEKHDLQAGDLVFFETYDVGASHVGIYMGGGQFIHASSGAGAVTVTPLNKPYYAARYLGARRVL